MTELEDTGPLTEEQKRDRNAPGSLNDHVRRANEARAARREAVARREVAEVTAVRGSTHGDFTDNGIIMQGLKDLMRTRPGWARLSPHQREALDMIQHKIGRILSGDPNYADHWLDIEGYARIVRERL